MTQKAENLNIPLKPSLDIAGVSGSLCVLAADKLGDELCKYCPLEKKGVYSVPGGFVAGCEGSRCEYAAENCTTFTSFKSHQRRLV